MIAVLGAGSSRAVRKIVTTEDLNHLSELLSNANDADTEHLGSCLETVFNENMVAAETFVTKMKILFDSMEQCVFDPFLSRQNSFGNKSG